MIVHSFHQLKLNRTLVISSWNDSGAVLPAVAAVAVAEAALDVTEVDSSAKTRAAATVAVAEEDELGGEGREVYDRERTEVLDCFADSDDEEKKEVEGADPLLEITAGRVEEVKRDRVEDRLRYDRSGEVVVKVERGLEDWATDWKDRLRRRVCAEQEEEEAKETVPWVSRLLEAESTVRGNMVEGT